MAVGAPISSPAAHLQTRFLYNPILLRFRRSFSAGKSSSAFSVVSMAPRKKVLKYDDKWKKQWYGAGLFFEASEEINIDVGKELEKRNVLSNVEKSGLLSKAEDLGLTLSSLEKLKFFSKAEELGLLSLLENLAGTSPAVLTLAALPALTAAIVAVVVILMTQLLWWLLKRFWLVLLHFQVLFSRLVLLFWMDFKKLTDSLQLLKL